jgi:hypothetical protein
LVDPKRLLGALIAIAGSLGMLAAILADTGPSAFPLSLLGVVLFTIGFGLATGPRE